jgi:hypothetical protein
MYSFVLVLHSLLRWVVILAGLLAVGRAVHGWRAQRGWTRIDGRAGLWFTIALDIQLLIGLLLYFGLSPFTELALQDFGGAMRDSALRFWAVEHVFGMIVGLVLAHLGRVRIRKARDDARRHRLAAIFFGLALLAIFVSIPWPGMPNGRPLLRW